MRFLLDLAWRDLRRGGRALWVFAACLVLGVALVAAGGALYRQAAGALQADVRALFGGDVQVRHDRPLDDAAIAWMRAHGTVSRVVQLRTMLRGEEGRAQLVELQSVDAAYPLYGTLTTAPAAPLASLLAQRGGTWGIALDGVLARRMALEVGDRVEVGDAALEVRALLVHQPDRSLRPEWNGAPVMVADGALAATGLIQPASRVEYRWRVRTAERPAAWRDAFMAAFPRADAEIHTVQERSDHFARMLDQVGAGLLLVGFSALFIGGLGVFNSVKAYLDGKLATLATLRALGLRDAKVAAVVLLQVLMLALASSAVGAALGGAMALGGVQLASARAPMALSPGALVAPLAAAVGFGVMTALAFALPALGRALAVTPAALFRGIDGTVLRTPRTAWIGTAAAGAVLLGLLLWALPDARFGLAFLGVVTGLLLLLEGVLRGLRWLATRLLSTGQSTGGATGRWTGRWRARWQPPFEFRVALSALQRPGSPLRASLLSLGSALTLLVACTLVVAAVLRTMNETVPQQAPALVFHDVQPEQLPLLHEAARAAPSLQRLQTAPLVLGRVAAVNGQALRDSADPRRRREARDEQKLSHRAASIDDVVVTHGAWWPASYRGPALVALEDREAWQIGAKVGDRVAFDIMGSVVEAEVAAIYAQRRWQSRLWLEALFSDGVLDPFVTRHVGAAYIASPDDAIAMQDRLAEVAPNVASVRTQALLDTVRDLAARASAGLAVIAAAVLAASLLVLASVVAASRSRQVYEASVMHALGARVSSLRRVLRWEYALLAIVTASFAVGVGSVLAVALLRVRLELDAGGLLWTGALTAFLVSIVSLGVGAQVLMAQMRLAPARLLRSG